MGGEMCETIMETGAFSEELCRHYFKQLLQTIHYLHKNGVAHRDLKPDNIMIDNETHDLKLIDFGFTRPIEIEGSPFSKSIKGTPMYMAPEI